MIPAAIWLRVSTGHQDRDNHVPDIERFTANHGHDVTQTYTVSESAWNGAKVGPAQRGEGCRAAARCRRRTVISAA